MQWKWNFGCLIRQDALFVVLLAQEIHSVVQSIYNFPLFLSDWLAAVTTKLFWIKQREPHLRISSYKLSYPLHRLFITLGIFCASIQEERFATVTCKLRLNAWNCCMLFIYFVQTCCGARKMQLVGIVLKYLHSIIILKITTQFSLVKFQLPVVCAGNLLVIPNDGSSACIHT